jgi:hypothetical protein
VRDEVIGKMKRRNIGFALLFLFIGSVFGPIIHGSISALFWSSAADTNDIQDATHRLYALSNSDAAYRLLKPTIQNESDFSCESSVMKRFNSGFGTREDIIAQSAALKFSRDDFYHKFEERGAEALDKLPAAALGALEACIRATTLSAICRNYVDNIVNGATKIDKKTEALWLTEMKDMNSAVLCAAEPEQLNLKTKRAPKAP